MEKNYATFNLPISSSCMHVYMYIYVCMYVFLMIVGNEEVTAAHTGKFCGLAFSFPSCKEAACNTFCVNKHINVSGAVRGLCDEASLPLHSGLVMTYLYSHSSKSLMNIILREGLRTHLKIIDLSLNFKIQFLQTKSFI